MRQAHTASLGATPPTPMACVLNPLTKNPGYGLANQHLITVFGRLVYALEVARAYSRKQMEGGNKVIMSGRHFVLSPILVC